MTTLITIIHIVTCVLLVLVVLIQSGKGAEISASFGGSSQTVFGSSGGANFFTTLTQSLAAIFMVTSILLTVFGSNAKKSVFGDMAQATAAAAPSTLPSSMPSEPATSASPAGVSSPVGK